MRLGSIVRRGHRFGVVLAAGNARFPTAVKIEWSDGTREWVAASEVECTGGLG